MFDSKEEVTKQVDKCMAAVAKLNRGDILPYSVIEKATGCQRHDNRFKVVANKLRSFLLKERNIGTRAIVNVGYRLLDKKEQLERCSEDRQRRMFSQSRRCLKEVSAVPVGELSIHDQRFRAVNIENVQAHRRSLRRGLKAVRSYINEALPRRPSA